MGPLSQRLVTLSLAAALMLPAVVMTGCAARVDTGYRVYDPYYGDYHVFDDREVAYYNRWEHDTHRDHKDFRKRPADERKQYWDWRHTQH